jgi:hypothetical protein
LADGKLRIRDRLHEDARADADARYINRGKVCETWLWHDLIDVMWEIGVGHPGGMFPNLGPGSEEQIIGFLLRKKINKTYNQLIEWPLDKLIYYYKWYSGKKTTRDILCRLIHNKMEETGRLMR